MLFISYLKITAHVIRGVFTITFLYPRKNAQQRYDAIQQWSHRLLNILNVQLEVHGTIPKEIPSCLVVSNHISWLDIHVLNAVLPMRFVAKKEVASWPVFGWFAKKINTLFIDRQKSGHSKHVSDQMVAALKSGDRICIFPEGTSTDGLSVLKFRSNLFQAVIDAHSHCIPTAISYFNPNTGDISFATAFIGDMGLLESINNTLKQAPVSVRVKIGDPIQEVSNRKELSETAWEQIVAMRN